MKKRLFFKYLALVCGSNIFYRAHLRKSTHDGTCPKGLYCASVKGQHTTSRIHQMALGSPWRAVSGFGSMMLTPARKLPYLRGIWTENALSRFPLMARQSLAEACGLYRWRKVRGTIRLWDVATGELNSNA